MQEVLVWLVAATTLATDVNVAAGCVHYPRILFVDVKPLGPSKKGGIFEKDILHKMPRSKFDDDDFDYNDYYYSLSNRHAIQPDMKEYDNYEIIWEKRETA
jgi:hypothetical protein